ncbi:MAG: hypothetical protein BWY24_00608 [Microgenomates group bacterium ADurb.Bin219]|nr:MAG: hypothetical protein BWY24_00608 [Microgenomates group bacterium ADurb.Bin219]
MDQSETIIAKEKTDSGNSKQKKVFSLLALTFLCVTLVAGLYLVGKRVSFRKKANENCSVWFDNQINTNLLGEGRICKVNRGEKVFDIQAGQSSDQNKFRLDWMCDNDISSFAVKDASTSANISGMCFLDASATRCSLNSCIPSNKKAGYVICKGFNPGLYNIKLDFSSTSSPTATPTQYCLCSPITPGGPSSGCYRRDDRYYCATNINSTVDNDKCPTPSTYYRCYDYQDCGSNSCLTPAAGGVCSCSQTPAPTVVRPTSAPTVVPCMDNRDSGGQYCLCSNDGNTGSNNSGCNNDLSACYTNINLIENHPDCNNNRYCRCYDVENCERDRTLCSMTPDKSSCGCIDNDE